MKLTDICVSLELAKELKEAGYSQESLFYWGDSISEGKYILKRKGYFLPSDLRKELPISAPTVAELGEKYHKLL